MVKRVMHKRGKVIHFFHTLTLQLSTIWGAKKKMLCIDERKRYAVRSKWSNHYRTLAGHLSVWQWYSHQPSFPLRKTDCKADNEFPVTRKSMAWLTPTVTSHYCCKIVQTSNCRWAEMGSRFLFCLDNKHPYAQTWEVQNKEKERWWA